MALLYQKAIAQQFPRALAAVGGTRKFAAAAAASTPPTHEWPNHSGLITTSLLRKNNNYGKYAAIAAGLATAQYILGEKEEFFDYRFITDKKPEDLADFYGTEAFMDIFCVFPFMATFMMRSGEFDELGHVHTFGMAGPGSLEVSIDFDEVEEDTSGDGELDTIAWFNKRESFEDKSPLLGGATLWRMTQNFGYHRLHNGDVEVITTANTSKVCSPSASSSRHMPHTPSGQPSASSPARSLDPKNWKTRRKRFAKMFPPPSSRNSSTVLQATWRL